jgi:hypothetical protein
MTLTRMDTLRRDGGRTLSPHSRANIREGHSGDLLPFLKPWDDSKTSD